MNPEIIEKLEKARVMIPLDEGSVDEFMDLLDEVTEAGDPSVIGPILLLADDNLDLEGVVQSMLGFLEDFSPADYAAGFLGVLEEFSEKSPSWCLSELRKILWSNEADALIEKASEASSSTQRCLVSMLMRVKDETPRLAETCEQLLTSLGPGPAYPEP